MANATIDMDLLFKELMALPRFCRWCGNRLMTDDKFCDSNCKFDHADHFDAQGAKER